MALLICPQRQSILDESGPILVTGGPGSGKTTIALAKAQLRIADELALGQSVLFLSFSRAAVTRIADASKAQIAKPLRSRLSIQTFHSFFWELLRAHGYLLGAPRSLRLLLPHDEDALRHQFENDGLDWITERERLFREDGVVAFDLFSEKAHQLLLRSATLRATYGRRHPLIIVDEAQDTAEDQWQCVRLLSERSQLMCLADLEQQIFDFRPGVSSERVTHIMEALRPLRVDLSGQNHRSANSEIVSFANDILLGTPRGRPYKGVSRVPFRANRDRRDNAIRSALGRAYKSAKEVTDDIGSIAFLTTRNRGVAVISRALTGNEKSPAIAHRVLVDEAPILLSSRVIAFLMEPRRIAADELADLADGLDATANVFRSQGGKGNLKQAQTLAKSALDARAGKGPGKNTVAFRLLVLLRQLREHKFSGDPKRDWIHARECLRNAGANPLAEVAAYSDQLAAFQRGRRISAGFAEIWQNHSCYQKARAIFDAVMAEEQLLVSGSEFDGIHVMTIHKSKGKEFDAVILFDDSNSSPFLFFQESAPYPRCRKLLRVGVTRAKHHALLLTDMFTPSPLLTGHSL